MEIIFNSIYSLILLYSPTILMFITQIVDWVVTLKRVKRLDLGVQLSPLKKEISSLKKEIHSLEEQTLTFCNEKAALAAEVANLKGGQEKLVSALAETNEYLRKLSEENIELKAKLRERNSEEKNNA